MPTIIRNGIIYGGGGGLNVSKTILLESVVPSTAQALQYSQPIENFDYISIIIHDSVGNSTCVCIPKENYANAFSIQTWIANNGYISFYPSTGEVVAANNCTIDNIIGYKFIASSGGGSGNASNKYSTEEQIIGTWIDGKPIYRKVLDYSSDPWTSGTKDIFDLHIEQIVSSYFIGYDGANGTSYQWAQGVISNSNRCLYFSEDYSQMLRMGSAYYKYVILEYTKATQYPEYDFVTKYNIITTATGGFDAAIRVTNILDGTSTDIVYTSVNTGNYVDFGEFTIRYVDQYIGWELKCTSEAIRADSIILLNGKSKNWLYNANIDFEVQVTNV